MGLSYSFLVYSRSGTLDLTRPTDATEAGEVMRRLFPLTSYRRTRSANLLDASFPPRESPAVGVFESGVLISTRDAHLYDPDILNARYLKLTEWPDVRLLTSRSFNDMFAYGHWVRQSITRCFSVNAVAEVHRDDGTADHFEGGTPVTADRWLDLSNRALASVLNLEGDATPSRPQSVAWDELTLHVFERPRRKSESA